MPRHRRVRRSAVRRLSQAEPAVVRLQRPAHPDGHRRPGHLLRAARRTPARGVRLGQHDHQERHLRPDVLLDAAPRQGAPARPARLDDDQHVHDARGRPRPAARVRLTRGPRESRCRPARTRAAPTSSSRSARTRRRRAATPRSPATTIAAWRARTSGCPSSWPGARRRPRAHGRAPRASSRCAARRARRRRSARAVRSPGCATTRSSATSSAR